MGCSCGASLMGKDICGRQIVSSGKEVLNSDYILSVGSALKDCQKDFFCHGRGWSWSKMLSVLIVVEFGRATKWSLC